MKNIYCSSFGHQYVVTKHVTAHVKEYACKRCQYKATTSGSGGLTYLNKTHKEINSVLEDIYKKRKLKKKQITASH